MEALLGKRTNISTVKSDQEKKQVYMHGRGQKLTLCDAAAKPTLEAAPSLYELHVRTHVGLTAIAADWTALAVVHQVWRALTRDAMRRVSKLIHTI